MRVRPILTDDRAIGRRKLAPPLQHGGLQRLFLQGIALSRPGDADDDALDPWQRPRSDASVERKEQWIVSRGKRKRVEMRSAPFKRILSFRRLRLRGPCSARDELHRPPPRIFAR
jgi:hypothetical protein